MLDFFLTLSLIAIIIGSWTDIRTLEVPDWLNYTLIAVGIGGNLIYTIVEWDAIFIIRSLLGLAAALALGLLMFYTGQWGGGDSKMLFGLGAMIGVNWPLRLDFFWMFLVNMLFAGAAYGLAWVIAMAIIYRKKLSKKISAMLKDKKLTRIRLVSGLAAVTALIIIFFIQIDNFAKLALTTMLVLLYFLNYMFVLIKAVEEVAMIKTVDPEKLTEGDWIAQEIKVDGKHIAGPKELGLEKKQLKEILALKALGKITKVKVKYGIPFVPSFLIAFVFTLVTNQIVLLMLLNY
ncbi:MAG: A24 family peptidase [archaeon]